MTYATPKTITTREYLQRLEEKGYTVISPDVMTIQDVLMLYEQLDSLRDSLRDANEGAHLMYSLATGGEQSVLSRLDSGADAVDAHRWQDDRCYESASSKHISVPIGNGATCIACGDTTDPRTPAQIDADKQDADWQAQVSGMRS